MLSFLSSNSKFSLKVLTLLNLCLYINYYFSSSIDNYMKRIYLSSFIAGSGALLYQYIYNYKPNQFRKEVIYEIRKEPFIIKMLTLLPLNLTSRVWGKVNSFDLPVFLRHRLISLYVRRYKCDLTEAADDDLKNYRNLGEFFRRKLKPELRPIDEKYHLVSPCDGDILTAGEVISNEIEQVKGKTYSLHFFLGHKSTDKSLNPPISDYLFDKNNRLFYCVIYLSPGDYHRFHSPANWSCIYRRHFPGYLLSVSPKRASSIPQLFNLNERVGYSGEWIHGFFNFTAIGATNVGSIRVYHDQTLATNKKMIESKNCIEDISSTEFAKGEPFGEFNFGSTIVLIFEAPSTFKFVVTNGDKIKYGQALG